jgi:hypothetical protein
VPSYATPSYYNIWLLLRASKHCLHTRFDTIIDLEASIWDMVQGLIREVKQNIGRARSD